MIRPNPSKLNRLLLGALRHISIALDSNEQGVMRDVVSHSESAVIQLTSLLAIVASTEGKSDVERRRTMWL
jgi:hypothetical protein